MESFIMYRSFHESLSGLSPEQYGKIMYAINDYALNWVEPNLTWVESSMFILMKPLIDSSLRRYRANIENGKKWWRPQKTWDNSQKPNYNPTITQNNPTITQQEPNKNLNYNYNLNYNSNYNSNNNQYEESFQEFLKNYPKHDDREKVREAFDKLDDESKKHVGRDAVIQKRLVYYGVREKRYMKNPIDFLNQYVYSEEITLADVRDIVTPIRHKEKSDAEIEVQKKCFGEIGKDIVVPIWKSMDKKVWFVFHD